MHHLNERGGLTVRTDKLSKTNLILYACGLIPVIWLGLFVAPYIDGGLVEIIKNLSVAFNNPFNISIQQYK